ncbi:MAG: maleylpyruvate isomerase family mycothiol-dependent enzyme [Streptosporangiales bacterium]|nr:maleylpyruvate isomerase family mycothiol-dependent enzyme [Streptosporangiales bacterium]
MNSAEIYDAARKRIVELVRAGDQDAAVAACPGWTVRDLVAHLAGGLGSFLSRDFDAGEYANHGERTVHERRGRSFDELLAEWERHRAAADEAFASPMGGVLVAEIVSHEHDIRTALARPGARDDEAVRAALDRPLQEIDRRMRDGGLPALRILVNGEERVLGEGDPAGTLRVTAFELLRSIGGRRSQRQVRALDWDVDPEPFLGVFTLFGEFRADDLEE